MTKEELTAHVQGLTVPEAQLQFMMVFLEEVSLLRKAIELHSATMVRLANGMEHGLEQQFHSVR